MTCPRCGAEMESRSLSSAGGDAEVHRCPEGHGVFLSRADLGALSESESDWHRHTGQHTAPMPRITADMGVDVVEHALRPIYGPTSKEMPCASGRSLE